MLIKKEGVLFIKKKKAKKLFAKEDYNLLLQVELITQE